MAAGQVAITKLAARAQRSESQIKRIKMERQQTLGRVVSGVEILAGGAAGGFIDGYVGGDDNEVDVFGIPVIPVVGGIAAATAMANYPGATHVGSVGLGAVTYWLGRFVRDNV